MDDFYVEGGKSGRRLERIEKMVVMNGDKKFLRYFCDCNICRVLILIFEIFF